MNTDRHWRDAQVFLGLGALLAVCLWAADRPAAAEPCVSVVDDLVVRQTTTFCRGTYRINDRGAPGVIIVGADDITLDGDGLTLNGKNSTGYGIVISGHTNVVAKNFNITRFHYAIRIDDSVGVVVEQNRLWGNGGTGAQFYDINRPLSAAYGGGILLNRARQSVLRSNGGSSQNVGLDLYDSSGNLVTGNDFSDSYGWGVRLYASTDNEISANRFDHVHGCRGANCSARDTAGVLLVYGSDGNLVAGNSMIDGGNGFFIGNEHGLPSNDNVVEDNDCSSAIHNAIEATFSSGNVFRRNLATRSAFGFWLGFSHHSTVEGNIITDNGADGLRWEHGRFGSVVANDIARNAGFGMAFTLNPTHPLIPRYPGSEASHHHFVADNTITDNAASGVFLQHTTDSSLHGNRAAGNVVNVSFEGGSVRNVLTENGLVCTSPAGRTCQYSVRNDMPAGNDVDAEWNWWGTDSEGEIAAMVFDGLDDSNRGLVDYDPWQRCGDGTCSESESPCSCAVDCGAPPSTEAGTCGDGIDADCDGAVDCADDDCATDPACSGPFCGDNSCDYGEDQCTCAGDCGIPPALETACGDGRDDDCDGAVDCQDPDCQADVACRVCLAPKEPCSSDTDCCSGRCRGAAGSGTCR